MIDYQYQPAMDDPISKLRVAMGSMDGGFSPRSSATTSSNFFLSVEALRTYTIPQEKADYIVPMDEVAETDMDIDINIDPQLMESPGHPSPLNVPMRSNLRLFPPPLFSRQTIPQAYKCAFLLLSNYCEFTLDNSFKSNTASMVSTTVDEETGEEKKRLINRMRWKGYGPASIMFTDANVRVTSFYCGIFSFLRARSQTSHLNQSKKGVISSTRIFYKNFRKSVNSLLFCIPV
jgi:general transcription factor 3C polypeptide 5 (transcription factor C subunit 1)